ncbi:MAG: hypothetical protein ABI210_00175 [Abditibacteriaceae bacterium]
MQAYRVETTIEKDGSLTLQLLPFQAGESIEVIVLPRVTEDSSTERYPLRGQPVQLIDPFEPLAQEDWGAAN